jgi:leucyl/phenylalanyl-tRNA--protein transferase
MPTEPPATGWVFPDLADLPADGRADDLVGMGADLEPGTLLAAYRRGLFPMPAEDFADGMLWWSPIERGVLPLDGLRVSRSLRQSVRRMDVRVDSAFADVIAACGDPGREGGWIDEQIRSAYSRLHALGWAHSVEAWQGGELVGGLYGVDEYADRRVLDVQWPTQHLASLGVVTVPRASYLRMLAAAAGVPLPRPFR